MSRHLIVNADDFGCSPEVNAGVVAAHDRGIVTSASLMVRRPAAEGAVELARHRPHLSLGLHVDLGEWVFDEAHGWIERDTVVDTADAAAVAAEVQRQLTAFEAMAGVAPTHLDGHQHVQRHEPAAAALRQLAARLGVPLRLHDELVAYRGDFYGQGPRGEPYPDGISVPTLVALIASLPGGWTELGCHPGIGVRPSESAYAREREAEVAVLCSDDVAAAVREQKVVLMSFGDLAEVDRPA